MSDELGIFTILLTVLMIVVVVIFAGVVINDAIRRRKREKQYKQMRLKEQHVKEAIEEIRNIK